MSFINSEQNQSQGTTGTVTCNMPQNMRLAFDADGTAVYRPINPNYNGNGNNNGSSNNNNGNNNNVFDVPSLQVVSDSGGSGGSFNSEPMKRKRGRPRKYSMLGDGSLNTGYNNQQQNQSQNQNQNQNQNQVVYSTGFQSPTPPPPQQTASEALGPVSPSSGTVKKPRGRPPGSLNKKPSSAGRGFGFIPHIITVKAGENILSKIMTLTQHGSRAVCVLSANGTISNVTLCQAATSGGTVTYEGPFEILSLSGSFLLSESGGQRSRTGGLSVSLAGPDGRVFGGGVAGLLTAGNSVQVICGSFSAEERKESKLNQSDGHAAARAPAAESPSSHGTYSESSGGNATASNQSTGPCNTNNTHGMLNIPWQ